MVTTGKRKTTDAFDLVAHNRLSLGMAVIWGRAAKIGDFEGCSNSDEKRRDPSWRPRKKIDLMNTSA